MQQHLLQLPYPTVEGKASAYEIDKLYDFYAGRFSELTSITSYVYQSVITSNMPLSEILHKISITEMQHFQLLAKALIAFGIDPVMMGKHSYFSCSYTNYCKDVREFLLTDIEWENSAKEEYLALANKTQNSSLCNLLSRIALDEEMHVNILKETYEDIFGEPIPE